MHLESKFTMSLVSRLRFFVVVFFWGGGVLRHLVVQTDFEFKISGPLAKRQFPKDGVRRVASLSGCRDWFEFCHDFLKGLGIFETWLAI